MRKLRRLLVIAALVGAPSAIVVSQPASAVWCGPEDSATASSCDCSVYVLKKKVIPCNN